MTEYKCYKKFEPNKMQLIFERLNNAEAILTLIENRCLNRDYIRSISINDEILAWINYYKEKK